MSRSAPRRHALCHHQHLRGQRAGLRQARHARLWQPRSGAPRDRAAGAASRRVGRGGGAPDPRARHRKVMPVVESLIAEYGLDRDQALLVGEGGGAGALMPFVAERHAACAIQDLAGRRGDLLDRRRARAGARDGRADHPDPQPTDLQRDQARGVRRGGAARRRAGDRRGHGRGRRRTASGCAPRRWAPPRCAPATTGTSARPMRGSDRRQLDGRADRARRGSPPQTDGMRLIQATSTAASRCAPSISRARSASSAATPGSSAPMRRMRWRQLQGALG